MLDLFSQPDPPTIHRLGAVTVVEVTGDGSGVIEAAHGAVLSCLAEQCRAVVCDLSALPDEHPPCRLSRLSALGELALHWPGTPIAVVCTSDRLREALRRQPMSAHLVIAGSLQEALTIVTRRAEPLAARLRLAPHPTAPRAARNFVTRTYLDWGAARSIASMCLLANELVTNATAHGRGDIQVSLSRADRRLRTEVRDGNNNHARTRVPHPDSGLSGRGLLVVDRLSRAWGVFPTWDEGKVVWAVSDE